MMHGSTKLKLKCTVMAFVFAVGSPCITCFRIITNITQEWPCKGHILFPECMPLAYDACLLHVNILIAMFVKSKGRGGGGLIYMTGLPYLESKCKEKAISIMIA